MLPYLYVYLLHYIHKPSFTHNITFVDLHVQVMCFCTVHVACLFHGIIISQKKKLIFQGIIPVSHTHNTSHIYMYIYIHANYRDCSEIDKIKVVAIVHGGIMLTKMFWRYLLGESYDINRKLVIHMLCISFEKRNKCWTIEYLLHMFFTQR